MQTLAGINVTRIKFDSLLICGGRTRGISLLFQNYSQEVLGIRRFGLKPAGMLKLGYRLIQIALVERLAAFGDIKIYVLVAIVRRGEFAPFL